MSRSALWNSGRFCLGNINGYWDGNFLTINYDKNDTRKYKYIETNKEGKHRLSGVKFDCFVSNNWFIDRNSETPVDVGLVS